MDRIDPSSEYRTRLERWRDLLSRADREFIRIGNIRLTLGLATALLAWLAFGRELLSPWWLLVPIALFIVLVVYHERIVRRQQFAKRGITYYERALARLDDRWMGTGSAGEQFRDSSHVYADDLDVFGKGSLFELLSTARTAAGEATLARWLSYPAKPSEVRARQEAIAELRDDVQLREDLALLGEDIRAAVHAEALAEWGAGPQVTWFAGARVVALLLALGSIGSFAAYMGHLIGPQIMLANFAVVILVRLMLRKFVATVVQAVETPAHDLGILALLLERLERESFQAPRLRGIRAALEIDGMPASRRIARLERWIEYLDSTDHLVVRAFGWTLLWREQVTMGIEAWRRHTGPHIGRWIVAVAELEALCSMAAFTFERSSSSLPELAEDGPLLEVEAIRHPLMSPSKCVANDVRLGGNLRLLIISGSNMSGKSTLLRSVGLNVVLAWAGCSVTASRMRVSPFSVGASIRAVDSLQDGRSRFYAEITRIRQIVDLTSSGRPVLFLLDELLSGTNSHDRRIGAEAVVTSLVKRGAVGFITTHDLALTHIAVTLDRRAENVHFEDHLENGEIHFDYKLKPGVVERSNALELMRAVGLEV